MRRSVVALACALIGCYRSKQPPPPPLIEQPPVVQEEPQVTAPAPKREDPIYPLDEALADALSGPLEHIGSGAWHGLARISVCAYRNDRVIVVNVYCTSKEQKASSIIVFSPKRGRVVIYAEADAPVSTLTKADYFTFKAESEPASDKIPRVSLAWTQAELAAWDDKRYHTWLPACYGGIELRKPQGGCLAPLENQHGAWKQRNQAFLDEPPEDWYRMVRELRARALRDAKPIRR